LQHLSGRCFCALDAAHYGIVGVSDHAADFCRGGWRLWFRSA
jgi:hypothetical protein